MPRLPTLGLTEDELIARLDAPAGGRRAHALRADVPRRASGRGVHARGHEGSGGRFRPCGGHRQCLPEVAHNYEREHAFNMWFVLATETPERIHEVIAAIERATGYKVYNLPKLEEFYVGLRFEA